MTKKFNIALSDTNLWWYNPASKRWNHVRTCYCGYPDKLDALFGTPEKWLEIFQKSHPGQTYTLSQRESKNKPLAP